MVATTLILITMHLPVPIHCHQTERAWQTAKTEAQLTQPASAYYVPRDHPLATTGAYIALSPQTCRHIRQATDTGAFILGHELQHHRQALTGQPFNETEADQAGWRNLHHWKTRLRTHFRVPAPPAAVRIAP